MNLETLTLKRFPASPNLDPYWLVMTTDAQGQTAPATGNKWACRSWADAERTSLQIAPILAAFHKRNTT